MTTEERTGRESKVLKHLLALGSDLPDYLAQLSMPERGAAVGLLADRMKLSPETVGHLITCPDEVEIQIVNMEEVPPEGYIDPMDLAIYAAAAELAERGAAPETVGKALGLSGLDWPPGSGDYHGSGPLRDPDLAEIRRRSREVGKLLASLREGEGA